MRFIVEEKASPETKEYLRSLHLKTEFGKDFDFEQSGRTVIEKETGNLLQMYSCHSNYPKSVLWEYILVYKKVRVIILLESFNPTEHKILRLRIPEIVWEEKETVLNLGIDMIFWYKKTAGPEKAPYRLEMTRETFIVDTKKVQYFKENKVKLL